VIVPSLLPDYIQARLLGRLLHRDLSNSQHNTNLHLHYNITYPDDGRSLFNIPPGAVAFEPKDPSIHKPLKMQQVLEKKLRWMTLGGQYDWTNKVYPADPPPGFPEDIAKFINSLFPDMEAQAAIVNVYSPGDTLSMHRDVSEEVDRGLVSISLGCDCIFVIGIENSTTRDIQKLAIRLRSGDVLYMTGESRLAWHGVPKIIPDTCPKHLMFWPGSSYPEWEGWMQNKRINLNVRQMREATKGGSKSRFTDDGLFQYLDFENVSVSSPINLGVVLGLMTTMD
jgi:alkylated DNA repair protein alkB homolog 1